METLLSILFFFGLIFGAVAIGLALLKWLMEALGSIIGFLAPGIALFILSVIFFGFPAEAAAAQGVTATVALGVLKSKVIGI